MPSPRAKLTPELKAAILDGIKAGAYPHIAAQAAGVPDWQFEEWMRKAKLQRKHIKDFRKEIEAAAAEARLKAETKVFQKDPVTWLTKGPGKDAPESPGWTAVVRPMIANHDSKTINLYTSPDFVAFMAMLRKVLAPHPEALKALVDIMDGKKPEPLPALPPPPPEPPISITDIKPSNN